MSDYNLLDDHAKNQQKILCENLARQKDEIILNELKLIEGQHIAINDVLRYIATYGEVFFSPYLDEETFYYKGQPLVTFYPVRTSVVQKDTSFIFNGSISYKTYGERK